MGGAIGPDELASLFDAHAPALALYARQWCDRSGSEDVVQEAFLALARERRAPDHPVSWLFRVVRNRAISWSRGAWRRQRREAAVATGESWFAAVDRRLDAEDATRLLAELDPPCREAIVARVWGNLNFDAIARLQGCSTATAFRRYRDGLSQLHDRMERPCPSPSPTSTSNAT